MKLHLDRSSDIYTFTGYGEGYVQINHQRYNENLVLLPQQIIPQWATGGFEQLQIKDFDFFQKFDLEILLLGTGKSLRFPPTELTYPLINAQIGLEVMDTSAACRTYNILAAEGRKIAAALILDTH